MAVVGYNNLNKFKQINFLGGLFGKNSNGRFVKASFAVRILDVATAIGGARNLKKRINEADTVAPWHRLSGEKWGVFEAIPTLLSSLSFFAGGVAFGSIMFNHRLNRLAKALLFLPVVAPLATIWAITLAAAQILRATFSVLGFATALALAIPVLAPISMGAALYRRAKGIETLTLKDARNMANKNNNTRHTTLSTSLADNSHTQSPHSSQFDRGNKANTYEPPASTTGEPRVTLLPDDYTAPGPIKL